MRINEVILQSAQINEQHVKYASKNPIGKIHPDQEAVMNPNHKFAGGSDRFYDLYRVMLALAMTDGKTIPTLDKESWVGRWDLASPFSDQEHEMLHAAYKAIGIEMKDAVNSKSCEPLHVNHISPVAAKKKNKYGV